MGRKGKWFGAVKKVFSPESKEKSNQKNDKKNWSWGKVELLEHESSSLEACEAPVEADPPAPVACGEAAHTEADNIGLHLVEIADVETAEVVPEASPQVVSPVTGAVTVAGKTREETAAIKIQTAFRCYLARRALRALKGLVRLNALLHDNAVKRQSATTLRCMQTLSKIQNQIRARRIRMVEENQALQRQLQLRREKEIEALRASMGEEWDDSLQSKDQIKASLLSKHEASIRRERTSTGLRIFSSVEELFKIGKPIVHRPQQSAVGLELVRALDGSTAMGGKMLDREGTLPSQCLCQKRRLPCGMGNGQGPCYPRSCRRGQALARSSETKHFCRHSPPPSLSKPSPAARRRSPGIALGAPEDDWRSLASVQSERIRRHSLGGSSAKDDDSTASSPAALPRYIVSTVSAKAKSRLQGPSADGRPDTPGKASSGSVKKRPSFPSGDKTASSPITARRHSGPPKMDLGSSEKNVAAGRPLRAPSNGDGG